MTRFILPILCLIFASIPHTATLYAATLHIGAARADITPTKRIPLCGSFALRLSQGVETPLTANVVVLESTENGKSLDQVVFVSTDLVYTTPEILVPIQKKVAARDSSITPEKIVVSGSHTHTGPILLLDSPKLPVADDVMDYPEVFDFISERIANAVVEAWKNRKPGKMAFGLDFGVVGQNRRTVFADGSAQMYGNMSRPDFRGMEAMEDHDIGSIFFLDEQDKMLAVIVNVSCPSQAVEARQKINADFWHPVRETLGKRFGNDVVIVGWCGASGDLSPHVQYRRAAVNRMNSLRKLDTMQEIARKIDRAVADTWDAVKATASTEVPLVHRAEMLQLPLRKITEEEYVQSKAERDKLDAQIEAGLKANPEKAPAEIVWVARPWHDDLVQRYEALQKDPDARYPAMVHAIRLGDTVILTNQFEMFTDFGIRMKARSPAVQTFVVQLTGPLPTIGTYLATESAVRGGGYSAFALSTPVGPEGGQILVEETLKLANELFPKQ